MVKVESLSVAKTSVSSKIAARAAALKLNR